MQKLFLDVRIILFSITTSIEYDLRSFIELNSEKILFTNSMIDKAKSRRKTIDIYNIEEMLIQLDLADYIELITDNPFHFGLNNEKSNKLAKYFDKIIPIRNRIAHTKPFELGDRSIMLEILDNIQNDISFICWEKVLEVKSIIEDDATKLLTGFKYAPIPDAISTTHNLPNPEFDDTGYIGRKREIDQLKKLIKNNKNQIISVVGNGGFGKTALVIKTLYEIADDPDNRFESIIWISLKTKTLSNGEFVEIVNSIKTMDGVILGAQNEILCDKTKTDQENLIEFMSVFRTILIIDNLETVSNDSVMSFLKDIPEISKVIITSRHGIGELELRFNIDGLNILDAVTYYREISKYYGLNVHCQSEDKIKKLIVEDLYSSPLSIKWLMTGLYNGLSESQILNQKDNLIEFCMSNVYEKLTTDSKKILQLFLVENSHLSYGELDYYMSFEEVEFRKAINELNSTNMINFENGKYSLKQLARDYLTKYQSPSNELVMEIFKKRQTLNTNLQNIKVKTEFNPYNPKSIHTDISDVNIKIAAYYLITALEFSEIKDWDKAFLYVDKAIAIAPDYYEIYKIKAFIFANKNEFFNAINFYDIAMSKSLTDIEKATVAYLKSKFYVINMNDYDSALREINIAISLLPTDSLIILEKASILTFVGKYKDAEELMLHINIDDSEEGKKLRNLISGKMAELYRRRSEQYNRVSPETQNSYLLKGIDFINEIEFMDFKVKIILLHILKDMSYLIHDEMIRQVFVTTIRQNGDNLRSINSKYWSDIRTNIHSYKTLFSKKDFDDISKYVIDYKQISSTITDNSRGIVVFTKDHFGFISNANYLEKGIYFKQSNSEQILTIGDFVEFKLVVQNDSLSAKNIRVIKFDEDNI